MCIYVRAYKHFLEFEEGNATFCAFYVHILKPYMLYACVFH